MTPVSAHEQSQAISIRSTISKLRSGNQIIEFIEGVESSDKFGKTYAEPLVKFTAPWIAMLAIGILSFTGILVNFCCLHCSCCKNINCCKGPKTNKNQKIYTVMTIVFASALITTSIAGIVFSAGVLKGGNQTICTIGILLDHLIEGNQPKDWAGLNLILADLQILFDHFAADSLQLSYIYGASDASLVNSGYSSVSSAITTMYNDNSASNVHRADPAIGGTYQPAYIQNLGPTGTATSYTGAIQAEVDNKKNIVVNAAQDITTSIQEIQGGSVITLPLIAEIQGKLQNASSSAHNMTVKAKKFGKIGHDATDGIGGAAVAIDVIRIGFGLASLLAIYKLRQSKLSFTKLINTSWGVIGTLMIFGWVISAILFPASVVLVESCTVSEKLQTDPVFYNQTFDKFLNNPNFTSVRNILYSCLFKDGDVLKALDVDQYFTPFVTLFTALDNTAPYTTSLGTVADSTVIPTQKTLVNNLKTGMVSDGTETDDDLKTLNKLTSSGSNSCTNVKDTWTLNSGLCPSSGTTVFTASKTDTYNLPSQTCIGFDAWGTTHNINNRYTSTNFPQPACGQVGGVNADVGIDNLVNGFVTSRQDVSNLFTSVASDLANVESSNQNFMSNVKTATGHMAPVRTQSARFNSALWNKKTGFLQTSNCEFVKEDLANLQEFMCVRLVSNVYELSVVMILNSFFGLFITISLFSLGKQFGKLTKKLTNTVSPLGWSDEKRPALSVTPEFH